MSPRRTLGLSACALFAAASATFAQNAPQENVTGNQQPQPAVAPASTTPARRPLMWALDQVGVGQQLDQLNVNIYGHVEAGYAWNFSNPSGAAGIGPHVNPGNLFDVEHDEFDLNQVDLTIERTVANDGKKFDVGGRIEWLYGGDAGFVHSDGLFDYYDSPRDPENQFDLRNAYVDVALPVGNGLMLRAGKFDTLLGQEVINPTGNQFYSHSYLFAFAIPFTHTGVLGTYNLTDKVSVSAGVTRGWDQSLEDNNGAVDFLGGVAWQATDKIKVTLNNTTGPQQAGDSAHYRTVFDLVAAYNYSDELTFAVNGDYGWEASAPAISPDGKGTSSWYGLAGYAGYKLCDEATLNGRVEFFTDDNGARGLGTTVYEATVGLTLTPFAHDKLLSNLKFRPELRYDFAQKPVLDGENYQVIAAMDVIFTF